MENTSQKTPEQKMEQYVADQKKLQLRIAEIAAEMNKQYANGKPSSD